jgi:hypothetical protein
MNMGFLKRFFQNVLREEGRASPQPSSFARLSEEELETHLGVARYGSFRLTDAIRPSYDLQIVPMQGYRHDTYRDASSRQAIPVLMAAASREGLFELFMELLDPLGHEVDVVLETSHFGRGGDHQDLYREQIDLPVLKSILWEFEDLLVNDGCTGIAVVNPHTPQEVQFDEHKLLIAYGRPLEPFEQILQSREVPLAPGLRFITEAEHVHSSKEQYCREVEQLKVRLGIDDLDH